MSFGSAGPSTIISPLFTTWPSWTNTCFSLGIRNSWLTPSRSVVTMRCLPFVSFLKDTVPVTSGPEEHTPEIQSLMRSSDAVVCSHKKHHHYKTVLTWLIMVKQL